MRRSFKKGAYGIARKAFKSVAANPRMAYRAIKTVRKYTSARAKGGSKTNASMLTFQKDSSKQYQRRKMPYNKKKKWVGFVRKVKAVEATGRGKQTIIINDSETVSQAAQVAAPFTQLISEVNLYSNNADIKGGNDQDAILNEVSNWNTLVNATTKVEAPGNFQERTRLRVGMMHANIDITYTNQGDTPLEVDFYTLSHRTMKFQTVGANQINSLSVAQNLYNDNANGMGGSGQQLNYLSNGGVLRSGGSAVSLEQRGVTPFNTPGINKVAGARILNKTKVLISPGTSITRRYSDNRHRYITPHDDLLKSRYDKHTSTYLAIAKPTTTGIATLRTGWTKNYSWTTEGQKNIRATYANNDFATFNQA